METLLKHSETLFCIPPNKNLLLTVVIPVKDEAENIEQTLDALRLQINFSGQPVDPMMYEVLVLANNCTDESFQLCRAYMKRYPLFQLHLECINLPAPDAHVGAARRILMDAAYRRLMRVRGKQGIIVSTDGDTTADAKWVIHILDEFLKGAEVVGGRILPQNTPINAKIHHLRDVTYRLYVTRLESIIDPCPSNPWPRHFQCYGPSLAVSCECYERAGRIPPIPYLEDEEFRKALKRVDAKIRHSPNVKVFTSARIVGRVAYGFSVQLGKWEEMNSIGEKQIVDSIQEHIFRLTLKNKLRKIWQAVKFQSHYQPTLQQLADELSIDLTKLIDKIILGEYFESLWEWTETQISHQNPVKYGKQPIDEAIQSFRSYFRELELPN
ncbi:glycosyltransferase family 2 protein [Pedobacter agri]|uniref:glycosyltransferase n=1 Tax=Pedobacter agri TaxID=454586 RepID=UPI00292ED9CD|nr:glycosyltransferase family 2 protein [Pedobacter agri]